MYIGKNQISNRSSKYNGQPSKIIFHNNRDRILPHAKHEKLMGGGYDG